MTDYKPKYARIDIREIDTKKGKAKQIQFPKGTVLTVNGVEMDLGEYGTAFINNLVDHENYLETLVESGKMKVENLDRDRDYFTKKQVRAVITLKAK